MKNRMVPENIHIIRVRYMAGSKAEKIEGPSQERLASNRNILNNTHK
jgi:hypothetical protein